MGFFKKKSKNELCNYCEVEMEEFVLLQCPNCQFQSSSEICPNCSSKMKEVELLKCPECANIMDKETLKEKWELKKKFEKLT